MTKRYTKIRPLLLTIVTLITISAPAYADRHWDGDPATTLGFTPDFRVDTGGLVDSQYDLTLRFEQHAHEDVATKYTVDIPSGWRFSIGSIKASTYPSCAAMVPDIEAGNANAINSKAEAVGVATIAVSTTSSNGQPVYMLGQSYFLNYVPATSTTGTATLCSMVSTTAGAIEAGVNNNNRRVLFQTDLTLNSDHSWDLSWALKAVSPLAPGTHSIVDNPYFQGQDVTVRSANIELRGLSYGNYNTDPSGVKRQVPFAMTPTSPGLYHFIGTAYPCGSFADDPSACASDAAPVSEDVPIGISNTLTPVHGMPLIQTPAKFSGPWAKPIVGTNKVPVTWQQVVNSPHDTVKGYVLTTGVPYQPDLIHFDYLVTNPSAPGFDPAVCGPDGAGATCAFELSFPLATTAGGQLSVNGVYSTSVLAVFMDGHRSDGRCDDGTGAGAPPPCPDGNSPQITYPDGFTFVEYVIRSKAWPLKYGVGAGSGYGAQLYAVLLDLDGHEGEFIVARPYGLGYPMQAATITGSNASSAGVVVFLDDGGPGTPGFGMQAVVAGTSMYGYFEFLCPITLAWITCSKLPSSPFPTTFTKL